MRPIEVFPRLKTVVEQADGLLRSQKFHTLQEVKDSLQPSDSGFYWIFTKLDIQRLRDSPSPTNNVHVHISELAKVHTDLKWVISQSGEEYWCVYNGKGQQLRNRIVAEFSNTNGATGTLALTRCFLESDFHVKYLVCGSQVFLHSYGDLQRHLERSWRLHYGWPVLCRA